MKSYFLPLSSCYPGLYLGQFPAGLVYCVHTAFPISQTMTHLLYSPSCDRRRNAHRLSRFYHGTLGDSEIESATNSFLLYLKAIHVFVLFFSISRNKFSIVVAAIILTGLLRNIPSVTADGKWAKKSWLRGRRCGATPILD